MKNLVEVPRSEQLEFINSFDHILSDLDGVIWLQYNPLPGAKDCVNILRQNGKNVHFVSNNSTIPIEMIKNNFKKMDIDVECEDIINPITAIVTYLKQIKFNKSIYVIALNSIKSILKQEGFTIVDGPQEIEESITSLIAHLNDDENIGAVLIEFDLNVNYIKLQKAAMYLRRKDVLFIAGGGDARLPLSNNIHLIGPHYYIKPLIDFSNREPYQIAKPSVHYNDFIVKRFKLSEPSRVLFIGDSVNEDLNFATKCGYQKLLVLTGVTKKAQLSNWTFPEEYKPQYYIENLNDLNEVIRNFVEKCDK